MKLVKCKAANEVQALERTLTCPNNVQEVSMTSQVQSNAIHISNLATNDNILLNDESELDWDWIESYHIGGECQNTSFINFQVDFIIHDLVTTSFDLDSPDIINISSRRDQQKPLIWSCRCQSCTHLAKFHLYSTLQEYFSNVIFHCMLRSALRVLITGCLQGGCDEQQLIFQINQPK